MQQLVDRAAAIRDHYKAKEATPGSGYHDRDQHMVRLDYPGHPSNVFLAPQRNGLPPASEHVVAFFDHDEETVTFAGPDAVRVHGCLTGWAAQWKGATPYDMPPLAQKLVYKIIPRLKLGQADGVPVLVVRLGDWNDVHYVLDEQKIGLQGTTADPAKDTRK